ncbi:response regulator receiver protein [Chitinophaga sp. Cy-1792]|uniref:response regulator receiver protein n=1 Tax=Chitinophaga sp. Cy-1792 TaxID=2608339 RepID=UPI00141F283F|nr:response regulator receiver protein [Chitinophaga sp. Cy-1792]NIG54824.1 response regulator receiver protein [Chitinophaga sp. Cy-1792]
MTSNISLRLLAIGYHPEIMQVLHRLMNSHSGWKGDIATSLEEATSLITNNTYDGILLAVGVTPEDETFIRTQVEITAPDTKIIRHYGGGSGLLENEIRTTFENLTTK